MLSPFKTLDHERGIAIPHSKHISLGFSYQPVSCCPNIIKDLICIHRQCNFFTHASNSITPSRYLYIYGDIFYELTIKVSKHKGHLEQFPN